MKDNNPLAGWVLGHVGDGKPYRSMSALALSAGLNENTVYLIVQRGRADPLTLVKLARAVGETPLRPFQIAGWLTESEATSVLEDWETALLVGARQLPPMHRRALLDVALPALLKLAQELPGPEEEPGTPLRDRQGQ